MQESENSQAYTDKESVDTDNSPVQLEEESSGTQNPSSVNIQNNLHFVQNIDLSSLNILSENNKDLADRAMSLYEKQFEHAKSMDEKIVQLEEREQEARDEDRPWQRFFAFLSISASVGISVYSLIKAYEFYTSGASDTIVGLCISIPVGIVAVNLLGIKNKGQK